MIGMDLLNLLYGDPLQRAMAPPQPAPNPNPQAPPPTPSLAAGDSPQFLRNMQDLQRRHALGPPGTMQQITPPPPSPAAAPGGPLPAPGAQPPAVPQSQPVPQSGPPSTSPQSPTDLTQLYMQLYNRQRSANEIDRGLSMMAAANSSPQMANAIMNSAGSNAQDPGQAMQMLMQMQYMQQLANMPAPSNIPDSIWKSAPPQVRMKLMEQAATSGLQIAQKGAEEKQNELISAQKDAPTVLPVMQQMDSLATQIKTATEADGKTPVLQSITGSQAKQMAAKEMIDAANADAKEGHGFFGDAFHRAYQNVVLTPEEKNQIQNMIQLNGMTYGDAFKSAGSRRTQTEIAGIKSGMSQLLGFNQTYDNYSKQFDEFQNKIHTGIANTYGAAGRVDEIPDNYRWDMSDPNNPKPRVDPAYLPNGDQYAGKGGQWASTPPKSNFDYASIPSGTVYTAPDGTQRRKP